MRGEDLIVYDQHWVLRGKNALEWCKWSEKSSMMVLVPKQLPFCRFKASWFVFSDTSFQLASEASASAAAGPRSGMRGGRSSSSALDEPPATGKRAGHR